METTWDLSVFYQGFDDPALEADLQKLAVMAAEGMAILKQEKDAGKRFSRSDPASGSLSRTR